MSLKVEPSGTGAIAEAAARLRDELRIGGEPGVGPAGAGRVGESAIGATDGISFGTVLANTAMAASAKEAEAVGKAEALAQGRSDDLHGTMITMKEAEISMKLVGSVRDKLLDAFHELWRINV